MATTRQAKALPEVLVEQGVLSPEQLQVAQAKAATLGVPLKQIIMQQGLISEEDLTALLAGQFGMMTVDLSSYLIKPEVVQLVPESLARKRVVIPLFKIAETLTVAVADPLNFFALDEVRLRAKCEVKAVLASESAIRKAIDQYYGATGTVEELAQTIEAAKTAPQDAGASQEAPVIRMLNLLITQAVKEGASDIHLEPGDKTLRTRFRIDGMLHEVNGPPPTLHAAVVSRIKVL